MTRHGKIAFAISEKLVRFYDFALLFKEKLGCDNALYLDGQICMIYLPEMGYKTDETKNRFAGMLVVTVKKRVGSGDAEVQPGVRKP